MNRERERERETKRRGKRLNKHRESWPWYVSLHLRQSSLETMVWRRLIIKERPRQHRPTTRVQFVVSIARCLLNPEPSSTRNLPPSLATFKSSRRGSYCFYTPRRLLVEKGARRERSPRCHSPDFLLLICDTGRFFPARLSFRKRFSSLARIVRHWRSHVL